MNEIIAQHAKPMIKDIALVVSWVLLFVVAMAKHFKEINDALPSLIKAWKYVQKQWFKDAIFRKDLMLKIDNVNIEIQKVKKEVQYNGGSITLSDAVKRLEADNRQLKKMVQHNKALRDVSDSRSEKMIFKMGEDGSCTFINGTFLKFFGYAEKDVLGYNFENIVHEDDVLEMRNKWQMAISRKSRFLDEQRIIDANGEYHKCNVQAYPICADDELIEFHGQIDLLK